MTPWFTRKGLFFRPAHPAGWLVLAAAAAFVVWGFFDIDSRSHSSSDTIRNTVFLAALTAVAYTLLAWVIQRIGQRK
jgi:hypothetical protein